MALFLGGPVDGWRIEVDTTLEHVVIPINPHPPAYTSDLTVFNATTAPGISYKRETIECGAQDYYVYVPEKWNCNDIIDALILGYKTQKEQSRLDYINSANGELYDNGDGKPVGSTYRFK